MISQNFRHAKVLLLFGLVSVCQTKKDMIVGFQLALSTKVPDAL